MPEPLIARDLPFPEVLWKLPSNVHLRRGKVLLIGGFPGHLKGTLEIAEVCGVLQVRDIIIVLPEGVARALPSIPDIEIVAAPETPSGTLANEALPTIQKSAGGSDCVLLGPDLSKQPETLQLAKELVRTTEAPLIISGDVLEAVLAADFSTRKRPTALVTDMGGLARLLKQSGFSGHGQRNLLEFLYKDYQRLLPEVGRDWKVALTITTPEAVIAGSDARLAFVPELAVDRLAQHIPTLLGLFLSLGSLHPDSLFECSVDALVVLRELIKKTASADRQTLMRELPKVVTSLAS